MVNIERVHLDAAEMLALINEGHRVRETPHLGGPHYGKYALTLGGLASDVVLVDTTKAARDKFGRTQDVAGVRFVSNKDGEQKPAAALHNVSLAGDNHQKLKELATDLGVGDVDSYVTDGVANLSKLHLRCVEQTAAQGVSVNTFAGFWRSGGETSLAMMEYLASNGLLSRWYDSEVGKITDVYAADQLSVLSSEGRYFDADDKVHGVLPTVESMLAIEAVQAAIEGREVTYDHLYVMSTEYTKDTDTVERIRSIAEGTLALLGVTNTATDYRFVITDNKFLDAVGGEKDHFAMMRDGERFNATLLMANNMERTYA